MKSWPVHDAKARFSELLKSCLEEGPQIVTRRGVEAAVLLPMSDWRHLQQAARPSLKTILLSKSARGDIPVIPRGGARRRAIADA